eukprot:1197316-Pyramimonas_sp.AAC.1
MPWKGEDPVLISSAGNGAPVVDVTRGTNTYLLIILDLSGETVVHKALLEVSQTVANANEALSPESEWVAAAAVELGGAEEW